MASTTASSNTDRWASAAAAHANTATKSPLVTSDPSKSSASTLLTAANIAFPFSHATTILDLGCGPGTVTTPLLSTYGASLPKDAKVLATDNSTSMVDRVSSLKAEKLQQGEDGWSRVETGVMDAEDLSGVESGSISHVLAGFVLFMVPDSAKALKEVSRVLQPGGILALTSWKANEWMDLCVDVCAEVVPDGTKASVDAALPDSWRSVDSVTRKVEEGGLEGIDGREFRCDMGFESADGVVRFLTNIVPHFREMIRVAAEKMGADVEGNKEVLVGRMVERLKKRRGEGPGSMKGMGVVVVGRKGGAA